MSSIRHVIWDFNGTLLDDVSCCVDTINTLLAERALPPMTLERYRGCFGFPVRDFYVELGFDFEREDFDALSTTFIARYLEHLNREGSGVAPHTGALDILEQVAARGLHQSVLSAMEHALLCKLLAHYKLDLRLRHARGLSDLRASSKVELGRALIGELDVAPENVVIIGDTLHDHETARAIGCECVLVAHGHQARARLERSGAHVVESLADVLGWLDARELDARELDTRELDTREP